MMKVKDTLSIDLVYATLNDKLLNFVRSWQRIDTDAWTVIGYIKGKFPYWQYTGAVPFTEVMLWCEHHLGNNWIWNFETIYFKTEQDRTAFLLRWA